MKSEGIDLDTFQKSTEGPFQIWEGDHTALVHVLWDASNDGLFERSESDPACDRMASMILRSRWLAAYVAQRSAVPPGPCWNDSGVTFPGKKVSWRCELQAGHAGAHECDRGALGGTAVWADDEHPAGPCESA